MDNNQPYIDAYREVMREIFYSPIFNDEEWADFEAEMLAEADTTYEQLGQQIAAGVANGYSLEYQMQVVRSMAAAHRAGSPMIDQLFHKLYGRPATDS